MKKYICIHGHFYQPPRENPWTGLVDEQESAAPHHDWNERIACECYGPNAQTQILNNQNQAIETINNYAQISFNFGPTLLSWMARYRADIYRLIIEADQKSVQRFSGHGAAIAQAYNHMIMPLANDRDQQTQVIWGIKDFEFHFKRVPEGMWIPETAVDVRTLEVLAGHGIAYTILAPGQARKIKKINDRKWVDVSEGTVDVQLPYLCRLPSGNKITLFFYNGPIANDLAFGDLLKNGVKFAERLTGEFPEQQQKNRLVHVANDGETYGHHHAFGNMALAYMLYYTERERLSRVTNYGEFLTNNPPEYEVQIREDTSWSCFHGVQRWKSHCGCRLNVQENSSQEWRRYLREALDWLRGQMAPFYEKSMSVYYKDPWGVRDKYIAVVLDRSGESQKRVLWESAVGNLSADDQKKMISLLESQRCAMLMYTSCGWFFDDISGLETVQILRYAARAIELTRQSGGLNLEQEFLNRLESAKSNLPAMKDGKAIYNLFVRPSMISPG